MFLLDVAKVDLDVACVAMTIHACFKRMFQVFHLFKTYVAWFHLDVFKIDLGEHMFHASQPALLLLGVPPWVTVRVPKSGRRFRGTHAQAGQVTGTHVGPRDGRGARDG